MSVLAASLQVRADDVKYWTDIAGMLTPTPGEATTFYCPTLPAGLNLATLNVYGTDVYTLDSSVCGAAVHAGLIRPQDGGTVTIVVDSTPTASFAGTARNGVTSKSMAGPSTGFRFAGVGTNAGRGPPNAPKLLGPADTRASGGTPEVYVDRRNPQVLLTWQDNGNANQNYTNEFAVTLWADYGRTGTWRQVVNDKHIGSRTSITVKSSLQPNSCYQWQISALDPTSQANPWEVRSDLWVFCTGRY